MNCPGCQAAMTAHTLDGHMGTSITIDVCLECQSIWFDTYESLQLAPGSTLKLFQLIGEQANKPKAAISRSIRCPRCESRLMSVHDRQRDTPFEYWRCDQRHGRFITFFNFLREKNFVRAMSAAQIDELRKNVHSVNCSNCGAPVDIVHRSACTHCGSPLSMLDMHEAGALIEKLREASVPKPLDPALPLNLLKARRETEAAFALMERSDAWWHDASSTGVVEASLTALAHWLNQKV